VSQPLMNVAEDGRCLGLEDADLSVGDYDGRNTDSRSDADDCAAGRAALDPASPSVHVRSGPGGAGR
jgi:hypothetical protein